MTCDWANDAPAIRLAHAGIALDDHCSPAAREAADLVVGDRIETTLSCIVERRALWASVRDALAILVGGNMGEVGFTVIATALAGGSPLGARQLLLVNLLTDMLPAMTIAMRPPGSCSPEMVLREGPDASLGSALVNQIALRATMTTGGALSGWLVARTTGRDAAPVPWPSSPSSEVSSGTQLSSVARARWSWHPRWLRLPLSRPSSRHRSSASSSAVRPSADRLGHRRRRLCGGYRGVSRCPSCQADQPDQLWLEGVRPPMDERPDHIGGTSTRLSLLSRTIPNRGL